MKQSRTENSFINVIVALSGQGIGLFMSFVTRIIFVRQLGDAYLGINSLFTNIVGLLALAELGVGTAINYSLYKPLAENEIEKVKSLMHLYKRIYYLIAVFILALGVLLVPFLSFFVRASDTEAVRHLNFIFILFVINSSVSYLYSYKRALIISDQKRYIATIYRYLFYCLMNCGQIIILLTTHNFILFLMIMLISTVLENISVSRRADKMYPYLKDKTVKKLEKQDTEEIKKNTIALLYHKIGSSVVNSTDNILISRIVGIVTVGIYSNYLLITNALNIVIGQMFNALVASVGNLGATERGDKAENILNELFYLNYCVVSVVTSSLFATVNLLIEICFGKSMILDEGVLICIVINFYLYQIRRSVLTFRDAYGLYWYDRYKALMEAAINLTVSIVLGIKIGLVGIFIGTIISCVATSLWVEPYILYKYAFKKPAMKYYLKLIIYTVFTAFDCVVCRLLVKTADLSGIAGFIIGVFLCTFFSLAMACIFFMRTKEFQYCLSLIKRCFAIIREKLV